MKHLEGSWGSGFRPNGTVRKDVGQRYEEEPSYVLDCKLQIGAVSSLSFIFREICKGYYERILLFIMHKKGDKRNEEFSYSVIIISYSWWKHNGLWFDR